MTQVKLPCTYAKCEGEGPGIISGGG